MLTPEPTSAAPADRTALVRSGRPTPRDGAAIWALVASTTLDLNSPYAYVLWGDHFSSTSRVARLDDDVVGAVIGYRVPDRPDTLFVWQVGVATSQRGRGLAASLLDELWDDQAGARYLEATVTPSNQASDRLFRGFAARHDAEVTTTVAYGEDLFPAGEDHEAEVRYAIGPIDGR